MNVQVVVSLYKSAHVMAAEPRDSDACYVTELPTMDLYTLGRVLLALI